ncbi:putative LPS assembly protein LptD [Salegentibacter sp. F188]|uniref:LPS assembly protein LptD n=1 Tax=Autumnicola patrickiae TaxID=3075591 RepID=A0ABU3E2K2_9FLAO|nr:putative LPS assembly protein LptD [Salegentibacter sp. F188]MDT0690196.1 putative LPS assembly protein LptD [Salegentibacter sp. F188]
MQTNIPYILFCCIFILLSPSLTTAQEIDTTSGIRIEAERDTLVSVGEGIPLAQTIKLQDSIIADSIPQPQGNNLLSDRVDYKATDYIRLSQKENRMYLYNNAQVTYGDIILNAGLIVIDNNKNEVYAFGIPDSLGDYTQKPVFQQAQKTVEPDSIRFNFDTERALIYNSRTQEANFNVRGEVTKRENDSVYFMQNVRFTTSEDVDNPDYYFYARRIKFVPDKKIVSGLVNMYIADVPTPLGLPFGYFPMTEEETSGFIIPSFGDSNNRGYFLQNGGYYFAISDYVDLLAIGDYYTNGSYAMNLESNYNQRYKFRGNFSFRYEKLLESERGFPDFAEGSNYNIRWSHSQDAKSNPSSRFSASVNLGSSDYYRESVNQQNTGNFLNNTLNSSVSYSKTFEGEPQVNLSLAARHSQNTNTGIVNLTLPTLNASMTRIYPFEPKVGAKKGIIENINFQYNLRAENRISTYDSIFFTPKMFDEAIYGAQHQIPINTNFKLFNYLSVSTGASFEENWVFETYERSYDEETNDVVRDTINGFDRFSTYNFNANVGTTLYGLVNFGSDKKIQAIRHVMRPNISYNINPAFDQYYDQFEEINPADPDQINLIDYSRFDGTLYGAPGRNFSSSIGLSLSNSLEAKVRDKDSTATEPKKVTLLNNFSIGTSYNLAGDSLRLSPIALRGGIPIIENKLTVNLAAQMDIYALDNNNRKIDRLNINNGGSLFRFTNANVSFGYAFSSKDFSKDTENKDESENETYRNGGRPDDLFGKGTNLDGSFYEDDEDPFEDGEEREVNSEWYKYEIPWDLRLNYTMTYSNNARQNEITSHSLMFSGNVELSPKWSIGASSGFDIRERGFTFTQLRFARDLESWRLNFSWVPFSQRKSWNFFIGIKSSILSDIKYEKRRDRDRRL